MTGTRSDKVWWFQSWLPVGDRPRQRLLEGCNGYKCSTIWQTYQMESGNWIRTNHTLFSLICGPIVMWLVWKIPRLHWSLKIVVVFVALFLVVGVLGMIDNLWYLPFLLIIVALRKGVALKPIRYLLLTMGIFLTVAAIAFVIYACYQKPSNILHFLFNPLSYVYFIPGGLCFIFANVAGEQIANGKIVKEVSIENCNS